MSRHNYLLFCSALVMVVSSSHASKVHQNDISQQRINEEAYKNRFNREQVAEEESGIVLLPRIKSEPSSEIEISTDFKWKMVLMTGDDSINAFDNARTKLHSMFTDLGIKESIQLSRNAKFQVGGVRATSIPNLEKAVHDLNVQEGEGCLIHMTSHGKPTGFYIRGQDYLTPTKLNQIINDTCGKRPTVLLVSACYAGIFAEPSMQANNRIILAAARKDKTSFGCSAEADYTYWDGCLVSSLPTSNTWYELAQQVEQCIEVKESAGGFSRSYPQARFGSDVAHYPIR